MSEAEKDYRKKLYKAVKEVEVYPLDAYLFLQEALSYTVEKIKKSNPSGQTAEAAAFFDPEESEFNPFGADESDADALSSEADQTQGAEATSNHVTGQQLCHGILEYAQERWGLMAGVVLEKWNITATIDFGKMVYAMIDVGLFSKTESDSLEDFRNVFDLREALGCRKPESRQVGS